MIILNKRVMSPRNILTNLVEGDINLLKKAQYFFTMACRSVVGYKQLARYLGVEIIVMKEESPVKPEKVANKYDAEVKALKAMLELRSQPKPLVKREIPLPQTEPNMFSDFSPIEPEFTTVSHESPSLLSYDDFVGEITKGILLKTTRRGDEVDRVVKAVWNKYKDRLESKAECRQLCIEIHKAFTEMLYRLPPNWLFVQSKHFIDGAYKVAVDNCYPRAV